VLQATTVVTPARFEQGLRYTDFLAQATVNRDKFELYYKESPLSDEDISFFKKAAALPNGPGKILALAEAWCGDVYRELPTVAHIAEATGMSLRVFLRDENPDIMDEFLSNNGKARAIPVFVFYTKETRYITHFTERSAGAHRELAAIMDQVRFQLNLPHGTTFGTVPGSDKQVFLREVIARITPPLPGLAERSNQRDARAPVNCPEVAEWRINEAYGQASSRCVHHPRVRCVCKTSPTVGCRRHRV
jgi:Thioredoxin